jgi:hypothetical protein
LPHAGSDTFDPADDLVTRNDRQLGLGELTVDHVQIRPEHPAGGHLHQHLAEARRTFGHLHRAQRQSGPFQHHCLHDMDLGQALSCYRALRGIGAAQGT